MTDIAETAANATELAWERKQAEAGTPSRRVYQPRVKNDPELKRIVGTDPWVVES